MSGWKSLESPKLRVPLELREVTTPDVPARVWEVQELRKGAVFKVTLDRHVLKSSLPRAGLTEAEVERAVCLAVEESLLSPPDKEPGLTYEVPVTPEAIQEATEISV
jgi:hypothetical protein